MLTINSATVVLAGLGKNAGGKGDGGNEGSSNVAAMSRIFDFLEGRIQKQIQIDGSGNVMDRTLDKLVQEVVAELKEKEEQQTA